MSEQMNLGIGKAGLRLNKEIALKVDWPTFADKLFKLVTDGFKAFNGDFKSGVSAAIALLGAAKAIKQDVPIGARGLELVLLCFAWSFDMVRAAGHINEEHSKAAAKQAIDSLKLKVEAEEMYIPADFFETPTSAEPYTFLRDAFLQCRRTFRPSTEEDEAVLRARFDGAFRSAIWDVWVERFSIFEELAVALNSPAAKTADIERQWRAYRQSLVGDFFVNPVFGQEESRVSLGQLYVPLRCRWSESERPDEATAGYVKLDEHKKIIHVRELQDELDQWLDSGDQGDWLRLIGGGPGSGKSTSVKAFAARIALRDDLRPIFVPLQRLAGDGRLRDNINIYFRERSGCAFRVGPLERKNVENGPRLVLIFDGLDEIARPGESADDIARDMIDWLNDLHAELTGETKTNHRVLITGRMPSFQAARRRSNRKGKEALEVLSYLPILDIPDHLDSVKVISGVEGEQKVLELDQRTIWWEKYSSALGRPAQLPIAFRDYRLASLTGEPLLCYLLALSGYLEGNSEEAAENRNKIYERLLLDVWKRGWGGGRAGTGRNLSNTEFNRLFETMALAAWHGGDERVATHQQFQIALKITRSEQIYQEFVKHEGGDVSNLAVNFYLKRAEEETRGFEFTHKSFGEYLTARCLIRISTEVANLSERRMDVAISDWLDAISEGGLSNELLEFLRDEARLLATDTAISILRALEKMMSEVISSGFPAHNLRCESWRHAEDRQRKAETMLMAMLHSLSNSIASRDRTNSEALIRINWRNDRLALGNLIQRIRRNRDQVVPALQLFSNLKAPAISLVSEDLIVSNFSGSDFSRCRMFSTTFGRSILSDVNFEEAYLEDTSFDGADLSRANFSQAHCQGAIFRRANLENANLSGADLQEADFSQSMLRGANLSNANLKGAKLKGAQLENTILHGVKYGPSARRVKSKLRRSKKE